MNDSKRTNHKKPNHAPVHARTRPDDGNAFFPDPGQGPARVKDDLAEELAEEFLESATSGEEMGEEGRERVVAEERGGPFVITSAKKEFAYDVDPSNPVDAERAPFPTTRSKSRSLWRRGRGDVTPPPRSTPPSFGAIVSAMAKLPLIEVGFQVFASDGGDVFGAVRDVAPGGRPEIVVYVENSGDFSIPLLAVQSVHSQKVVVDAAKLDPRVRAAIQKAHASEDR